LLVSRNKSLIFSLGESDAATAKIKYENQKVVELTFKDHYVGEGYPDLIVRLPGGKMVVELKAVGGELGASEEQQLKNYMKILKIDRGLLINFQQPGKNPKKTKLEMREITFGQT
jgi:GxxExxY protein